MFAFFRRRREAYAGTLIAQALAAQALYEKEHGERQVSRLAGTGSKAVRAQTAPGAFGADQRAIAVLQRVQRLYFEAGRRPPKNLEQLVERAIGAFE